MLRQPGEALAGCIACIDMAPLSALEVDDARASRERLRLRGVIPDNYLAASDEDSLALRRDFVRTYEATRHRKGGHPRCSTSIPVS